MGNPTAHHHDPPQWSLTFEVRKRPRDFFGLWLLVLHGFASAGQRGVCSGVVRLLWVE